MLWAKKYESNIPTTTTATKNQMPAIPLSVLCCITVLFFVCRTVNYYIDLFN